MDVIIGFHLRQQFIKMLHYFMGRLGNASGRIPGILICSIFLGGLGKPSHPSPTTTMRIQFTNLNAARGSIYLAIYNQESKFLDEKEVLLQKIIPVSAPGSLEITLPELPAGTYAISCFHDVNGNGKMDKNFLGVPTDPYGFSNNARPSFRAPNWEEAKFYWQPGAEMVNINLEKW